MTLPDDWTAHRLGELFEFSNGINADKSAYGQGTPFVNVLEVITSESLTVDAIPGRIALPKSTLVRFRVNHGDVLFNRTSETQDEVGLSSTYLGDEPVVFGGFVFRAQPKTAHLDFGYSKYCLRADDVRSQITGRGQGGIRSNIGQRDLKDVVVALPDVPEQRAIAEVLDDASALVNCLQALIAKKRDVKQGMMQELLTGRTRLPGFAGDWNSVRLGDVLTVRHGRDQKAVEVANGRYQILATGGQIGTTNTPLYSKPSVLIGRKGTIDRPQFQNEPFWSVDTLFYTEIRKSADPKYLFYVFQAVDWRSMNEASGVPSLTSGRVESVEVDLPTVDEQRAIRTVLDDANAEITALERRLESARAMKVGMMQELLTGRTRLPVMEEA